MTTPNTPPQLPPPTPQDQYHAVLSKLSLAGVLICPTLALLPPRKLDLYTFGLTFLFISSANNVTHTYTGTSIWERIKERSSDSYAWRTGAGRMPTERAREVQRRLREEREERGENVEKKKRGILGRLWMGDETEGWKERRLREEKEAIEDGRGYGGLIMDQIRDVWRGEAKEVEEGRDGEGKDEGKKED
ncbi:MAG: hypothetical protein M1820_001888 [Bogoriella megaspora]|nr:MAG: hypothetical protein M1820_001888 [Bogoriella megaspora]